jgi:hypothetical protein
MSIRRALENYGITSVYHFTDAANLKTIEKHGLQSLKNILLKNIDVKYFGAEELSHMLDQRQGLDKYVHLSFIKDHPMYHVAKSRGSLKKPVWIELDASILYEDTTLFSDSIANQTDAYIFKIDKVLRYIDFELLTLEGYLSSEKWRERKEARKAQLMALNSISTEKIKGITYGN